jgi:3-oxoacyl-[acyl-carrier protein] reductase
MGSLDKKTALVTGGSRGIGRAIALRLAADGAQVVLTYAANSGAAADVVSAITETGGQAWAVAADLRFPAVAGELLAQAESMAGPLDILVNNAAHAPTALLAECSDEEFASTMTVNVMSPFILMRDAARRLRDGGRIINISTMLTRGSAMPQSISYAMSKGALDVLTSTLAKQLGPRAITVNTVAPGVIDTDMHQGRLVGDALAWLSSLSPLGRVGTPEDVADAVAFLASDDSRWVTGHWLDASGGTLL